MPGETEVTAVTRARPLGRTVLAALAVMVMVVTGVASSDTGSDLVLTNTDQGFQQAWAFSLSKSWDSGFDSSFSYTLTDAKDVNPGTSSVAFSNWAGVTPFCRRPSTTGPCRRPRRPPTPTC